MGKALESNSCFTRNSNVEFLRFVLMLMIFVWHVLVHGFNLKNMSNTHVEFETWHLLLMSFLIPAVNCFVFISGYYGIKLTSRKFCALFGQAAFYYVIMVIFRWLFASSGVSQVSFYYIKHNLFPLTNSAWWFLTWYVVLLVISPFIESGLKTIPRSKMWKITVIMLFVNCFGTWLNFIHDGSDLMGLLTVYLLAGHLRDGNIYISQRVLVIIFLLSTIIIANLAIFFHHEGNDSYTWMMFNLCNPLNIIQAGSLFLFVKNLSCSNNKVFMLLGSNCFAIYLISEFSDNFFYKMFRNVCQNEGVFIMLIELIITCMLIVCFEVIRKSLFSRSKCFVMKKCGGTVEKLFGYKFLTRFKL